MSARGKIETSRLRVMVEAQLERLVAQLADLDELRDHLDDDEYQETKADTQLQLREFEAYLEKVMAGDLSLVSELAAMKLAMQAAISQAFKTPEVIGMFAKKQPALLRERLSTLQRDHKLQAISTEQYVRQSIEILVALKKLGDQLTSSEQTFLQSHMDEKLADFERLSAGSKYADDSILLSAENQVDASP